MNGVVLYRGPSLIDERPIVVIATGLSRRSENTKTGDMVATFILRADVSPLDAIRQGKDVSVCGQCRHRPALGGTCYVNVAQAPRAVWRAWKTGAYARKVTPAILDRLRGRLLRLGSYGDPAAAPLSAWQPVLDVVAGHSGYTHQWERCDPDWRRYLMASCDTVGERFAARKLGWRTFRVRGADDMVFPGEFACPASPEGGQRRTCATCLACHGATDSAGAASPTIIVHGRSAARFSLL